MAHERGEHRAEPVQRRARVPVLRRGLALVALALGLGAVTSEARTLRTRDAALAQAFGPGTTLRTRTVFLAAAAARRAEQAAGAKLASVRVTCYEGFRGDTLVGTGYVETHRVRSMNETLLVTVTPAGRVGVVEVLAFDEPDDYRAPRRWLDTFTGRVLTRDLKPGAAVPNLGGATLTARATAAAVRRTLALHAAIAAEGGGAR